MCKEIDAALRIIEGMTSEDQEGRQALNELTLKLEAANRAYRHVFEEATKIKREAERENERLRDEVSRMRGVALRLKAYLVKKGLVRSLNQEEGLESWIMEQRMENAA